MPHFPRARPVVAFAVAAWLLAACGGGDDGPRAATATVPPTTATTEAPSPTDAEAVPASPSVAYVQEVVDALDEVEGAAFQAARQAGSFEGAFDAGFRALYTPVAVERYLPRIQQAGLDGIAEQPGPPSTKVLELRTATDACIHALTRRDLGPILRGTYTPREPHHLKLVRRAPDLLNPTVWSIELDANFADQSDPGDLCR